MKSKTKRTTTMLVLVFATISLHRAWAQVTTNDLLATPLAFVEIAMTVISDTKTCLIEGDCSVESTDDGYEASKVQAMSNEELEEYVSKRK